jgi:hypothetical protein
MIDDAPWAASSSIAWKIRKFAVDTTPRKSSAKIGQLMRAAVFGDGSSSLAPLSFRSLKYSAGSGVACGGKSHGFSRQRFASRNTSARSRNEWTPSSASALIALSIGRQNF